LLLLLLLLQVGTGYKLPDGRVLTSSMPATIEELESVEVQYETLPGWQSDISGARSWGELPPAAQVRAGARSTGWFGHGLLALTINVDNQGKKEQAMVGPNHMCTALCGVAL
jgi:hypothetical protein